MPKTKHKPEATQKQPAPGQRWRHKKTGLEGMITLSGIWSDGVVVLEILDEFGCMTWRSTVPMFLDRWSFISEAP